MFHFMQTNQIPIMEHNSQMATLSERDCHRLNEELMARRLKNRERQRRYRAKKRLEADMKKSYLMQQQQTAWPVEPQSYLIADTSENSGASTPSDQAQTDGANNSCLTCIYSGRKWKKDARLARPYETVDSLSAKLLPEASPEYPASANVRRDWKADARNKIDVFAYESVQ